MKGKLRPPPTPLPPRPLLPARGCWGSCREGTWYIFINNLHIAILPPPTHTEMEL